MIDYKNALICLYNKEKCIIECTDEENDVIYKKEKNEYCHFLYGISYDDLCVNLCVNLHKNNVMWDIRLWDISFASTYKFPNNTMGFNNQWYLPKLKPFIPYLKSIGSISNIHISYKKIEDVDSTTLEKLYYLEQKVECKCDYNYNNTNNSNWCGYCGYDYNKNSDLNIVKKVCYKYNRFCFEEINNVLICDSIEDIYCFRENNKDLLTNENTLKILQQLENHYLSGYDFFTFYLPENIKKFDDFRVISSDGGSEFTAIALSQKYYYYFQYVY